VSSCSDNLFVCLFFVFFVCLFLMQNKVEHNGQGRVVIRTFDGGCQGYIEFDLPNHLAS